MKSLIKIKQNAEALKKIGQEMTKLKDGLVKRIEEIESEGRSESWTKDTVASAREQAQEKASVLLGQIGIAHQEISGYESFWKDSYGVLSSLPITPRAADGLTAENPFSESMTRMSILTEARLMSNERLVQSAQRAIKEGNPGVAYLLSLEGSGEHRKTKAKIDLSGVKTKEQDAALSAIRESNAVAGNAEIDFREITCSKPLDLITARLTAAHMGNNDDSYKPPKYNVAEGE